MSRIKKVGIIFGGRSTEHEISIKSGISILKNIDRQNYQIYPIYIDKKGVWYEVLGDLKELQNENQINNKKLIDNVIEYISKLDVIFPVMHGKHGEDGSIQGLLEILQIPYVGCGILASSLGMDKVFSKIIFENAGIKQAKYCYLKKEKDNYIYIDKKFNEKKMRLNEIAQLIEEKIKYPMFVKPSNSGSSVGITKVKDIKQLIEAIESASKYDNKILIEEGIFGKEVECAILGNDEIIASGIGEIISAEEFYSFDAKYNNSESKIIIPADIDENKAQEIRELAIKAFKAIDGKGLSRVDFFIRKDGEILINEINTMPGFTNISMYSKLWEEYGISYKKLIDRLIELAIKK